MKWLLLAALWVIPAHASAPPQASGVDAGIRAMLAAQVSAWNRGDVAGFMEGYWKSPAVAYVSASGVVKGWQQMLDRYRKAYPDGRAMGQLTFSNVEITVLAPDAALALGYWQLDRSQGITGGVFTLVVRRFPEGWRIINDHTSVMGHS